MNLWPIRIFFGTAMLVGVSAFFATGSVAVAHLLRQHSLF
jgi:hypothetical protein